MARKTKSKATTIEGRQCAAMQQHNYLAQTDETYRTNRRRIEALSSLARTQPRTDIIRIPVVVHVLFNDDADNISREQIDSQIDALNRDFRARNADRVDIPDAFKMFAVDTLIEFGLAKRDPEHLETSGITRTWTSKTEFPYDPFDNNATAQLDSLIKHDEFGKAAWPRDRYLNIWVCKIEGGLLGYAQFPGGPAATDGVVINNTAFGSGGTALAPFDLGRTAVHEVGHFLDLLHIWGDDNGGCLGSDNISDTPNQAGPNSGSSITNESFPLISCNNGPNGDMFMNYMDYVNDDTMVMFSAGQLERMNAALAGPRKALSESDALESVATEEFLLAGANMDVIDRHAEAGDEIEMRFDGVGWV
ncbi:zinc metalloprotease [Rhodobacteraceae bacterium B1Z28]|uniref:Zinc metalloprotease n=1 Tax=Ruegeria haliotis TaxID=2747601 RepID=A0ABX2PTS8_9RHOB|nr:zinc metalloprotease [Ruegeria haliotis]NVO57579.1 zinc metalloprotease [Ruegeria haliotis]